MPAPPRDAPVQVPDTATAAETAILPMRWSDESNHRHAALHLSEDGRSLTYVGVSSSGTRDSAAARTDQRIPIDCKNGVYFYEAYFGWVWDPFYTNTGHPRLIDLHFVRMSRFATGDARLRFPGWEKGSWGYHADDGWAFDGAKEGKPFAPVFESIPFENIALDLTEGGPGLYPCVGMRHPGESIRAKFGDDESDESWFGFDLEDYTRICTFEKQ
ncbi:hypothetical protein EIP86_005849 [Pleurotus ostreatoroseus]|nr:hypothetical protein EIP86_005849 [Pleurotus ostreatoroseus]